MRLLLLLSALLISTLAGCAGGSRYLQVSSALDQADQKFQAELVDAQHGVGYDPDTGRVTIEAAGPYFVIFAGQTSYNAACGDYWMVVNGQQVENSNIRVCQSTEGETTVAVAQAVLELEVGDVLQFETSGDLGTAATKPDHEPLIPSAIISVFAL